MKVIVIGAGVAGLGIGWRLAGRDASVVVIERAQPGSGATSAAAGMITAPEDADSELARHGAKLWPGFAAEIEEQSGCAISYRVDGGLVVAKSEQDLATLEARARSGAGEVLSADEARAVEPRLAPDVVGGLWSAGQAKVDNRVLAPALAAAFVKTGGALLLNETAVRFELHHDRIIGVRTPFALHHGDAYVLAAGAWSARLEGLPPDALPPVIPVKGEMIALEPPSDAALPRPAIGGTGIYLVAQRGQLVVGATVERVGFDSRVNGAAADWLFEGASALIPSLAGWRIAEQWASLRPGSPDDQPILGPGALAGLMIASGQYRNGILYAPAIAEAVSALILGGEVALDLAPFDPRRFAAGKSDV